MTWYSKQSTLTFFGKEGNLMKEKMIAMVREKSSDETKKDEITGRKVLHKGIENEPSTRNTNEGACLGSLITIVETLKTKFKHFELQFENFQLDTNKKLNLLLNKSESHLCEQNDLEVHRLQEENCEQTVMQTRTAGLKNEEVLQKLKKDLEAEKLASERLKLKVESLEGRLERAEEERDSLQLVLSMVMQDKLQQKEIYDNKPKEQSEWKTTTTNQGRKRQDKQAKQTTSNDNDMSSNSNRFRALQIEDTSDGIDQLNEEVVSNTTKAMNQRDNDRPNRPHCDVALVGDSTIKYVDTRKLRYGTNKQATTRTFSGCRTD